MLLLITHNSYFIMYSRYSSRQIALVSRWKSFRFHASIFLIVIFLFGQNLLGYRFEFSNSQCFDHVITNTFSKCKLQVSINVHFDNSVANPSYFFYCRTRTTMENKINWVVSCVKFLWTKSEFLRFLSQLYVTWLCILHVRFKSSSDSKSWAYFR
jgi:hypothetical protein